MNRKEAMRSVEMMWISSCMIACCCWPFSLSSAAQAPHALVTDQRVKQVIYDANQVVELTGTYGYQTALEFSAEENIKVVSLGDSLAWQTVPYRNRLFIKPVEPHAKTNMTVVTDKRSYYFMLDSTSSQAKMTFLVRFHYMEAGVKEIPTPPENSAALTDMGRLNFEYAFSGDVQSIPVKRVFDDGQFTFFQFADEADIPAVYVVNHDGSESVVNTRREGMYMVVERTGARFTLRHGATYVCIKNNAHAQKKISDGA
jgi:type IV secretion system protein VirB9